MKEHKWTEEDFELMFKSFSKIINNQNQIIKGIISLAKKEGMEITYVDEDISITKDFSEEVKDDS